MAVIAEGRLDPITVIEYVAPTEEQPDIAGRARAVEFAACRVYNVS